MSLPIDPPLARDFMNRHVRPVRPDMPLAEVVRFLLEHGLSSAPVVEIDDVFTLASAMVSHGLRHVPVVEHGDLVGLVSRREVLRAMEQYYRASLAAGDRERHKPSLRDIVSQQARISPVRPVEP
jgi:CBS domain-containing protein